VTIVKFEDYHCEFSKTEDEAIPHCGELNRDLDSKDRACCSVVDGPEDNYALVDLETARQLLDDNVSGLTCTIVTG
jgi:hypothetical protein